MTPATPGADLPATPVVPAFVPPGAAPEGTPQGTPAAPAWAGKPGRQKTPEETEAAMKADADAE